MPFFGVRPPPPPCYRCPQPPHETFTPISPSFRAFNYGETALFALMVLDALLWRQAAAAAVLSLSTLDIYTALAIVQGRIVQVETRLLCAHGSRCPSLASGRRRRCALAVHIGRLYRSRHRAGRSSSRDTLFALTVLDALLWRRTAAVAVCSHRPHRTFVPLSPSCRAIIQVETRSLCVHGSRCPSLASDRRRR